MTRSNRVEIEGTLTEMEALRYTPAGIPVVRFRLSHESEQVEVSIPRKAVCEIESLAFGEDARLLATAPLGTRLSICGFLNRKGRSVKQLILHVTRVEFRNQ